MYGRCEDYVDMDFLMSMGASAPVSLKVSIIFTPKYEISSTSSISSKNKKNRVDRQSL